MPCPKHTLPFTSNCAQLNSSHFHCKLGALPVSLSFFRCLYPLSKCSLCSCCIGNPVAAETAENMSFISPVSADNHVTIHGRAVSTPLGCGVRKPGTIPALGRLASFPLVPPVSSPSTLRQTRAKAGFSRPR